MEAAPWFSIGDHRVRLLSNGSEAFPAMLGAIGTAKREILLEMYWIGDDIVGQTFVLALAKAAESGIDVRVIYDAIGSLAIDRDFFAPLTKVGGRAFEYNSLSPLHLGALERRDHRKLLVVDGTRAFTGGINLAREWAPVSIGGSGWRDDMFEVDGFCAAELRTLFYRNWKNLAFEAVPNDVVPIGHTRDRAVWVLSSRRGKNRNIHREYVQRIQSAKRTIEIANPYFVPDRRVHRALSQAVGRGVSVRVLVPETSDVPLVKYAQQGLFEKLLDSGVGIYSLPGPMMHQKTAIIDDSWVTVGSYNLDERSFRKNLEINIAVDDEAFATYVRGKFDADVALARRVDLILWRDRSFIQKTAESVALAFRRLF